MKNIRQFLLYIVIILVLSSVVAAVAHATGRVELSILTVLTPSALALVMVFLEAGRRGVKELFVDKLIKPFGLGWLLTALLLFPMAGIAAVGLNSLFGGPELGLRTTQLMPQIIVILVISLGEEFGWRGYLLPRLQEKFSALAASLILGLVWGAWHFPASLIGTGVPEMPFVLFMVWVVVATVLMTWVYNNTGSVLTAILMHTMANATFNYLPLLPEFTGQMTTFSIFLAILGVVTAVVLWRFGPRKMVIETDGK